MDYTIIQTVQSPSLKTPRIQSIDFLRGIIMVIKALDIWPINHGSITDESLSKRYDTYKINNRDKWWLSYLYPLKFPGDKC